MMSPTLEFGTVEAFVASKDDPISVTYIKSSTGFVLLNTKIKTQNEGFNLKYQIYKIKYFQLIVVKGLN